MESTRDESFNRRLGRSRPTRCLTKRIGCSRDIPPRRRNGEDRRVAYWLVDGKETWRTTTGGVCQVPLYIKLSDEIGDWGGDIKEAKLPDQFLVDYVRVYDLVKEE